MDSKESKLDRRIELIKELCYRINNIEEVLGCGELLPSILPDYQNELDLLNWELRQVVSCE